MGRFRDKLRGALISCHKYGDFTLSCGGGSGEYYDLSSLFLSPNGLRMTGYEVMSALDDVEFDVLGCLELCPVPLVGAILANTPTDKLGEEISRRGFVVRKERKGHGTNNLIEGDLRCNDKAVILEDVTSTGQSVLKAVRAVEELGCKVVCILTIISRQEGCDELLKGYSFRYLFTRKELENG